MKLNKRQKFYLGTYLVGYAIAVLESGVPSIIYLIPLKVFGLILSITIGNALFMADERKIPFSSIILVNVKNVMIMTLLIITTCILKKTLLSHGIDISFITAPF
ncbi:hypothetical protein SH1V18_45570 [Vallitalea longa]|uniref:Uncharacterized protein n=1 Tax=Vallitalea longa TaxID=2936439 RepID=A0A9W5YDR2_9FIRM|nr:hypothetical protein [Vallitalea longa]GKX32077.1 hypothetical protein SH1V18_45570 [Vallitalea longa]